MGCTSSAPLALTDIGPQPHPPPLESKAPVKPLPAEDALPTALEDTKAEEEDSPLPALESSGSPEVSKPPSVASEKPGSRPPSGILEISRPVETINVDLDLEEVQSPSHRVRIGSMGADDVPLDEDMNPEVPSAGGSRVPSPPEGFTVEVSEDDTAEAVERLSTGLLAGNRKNSLQSLKHAIDVQKREEARLRALLVTTQSSIEAAKNQISDLCNKQARRKTVHDIHLRPGGGPDDYSGPKIVSSGGDTFVTRRKGRTIPEQVKLLKHSINLKQRQEEKMRRKLGREQAATAHVKRLLLAAQEKAEAREQRAAKMRATAQSTLAASAKHRRDHEGDIVPTSSPAALREAIDSVQRQSAEEHEAAERAVSAGV